MNAFLSSFLAAESNSGGGLGLILPLLLLGPLIYMMIVPQRKAKKKQAEFLAALGVGDEVVTSGGIHGTITFLEDNLAHVEVDTDVVIRVSKAALARFESAPIPDEPISADEPDDEPTKSGKGDKSAK